jgi:hypothetical protein
VELDIDKVVILKRNSLLLLSEFIISLDHTNLQQSMEDLQYRVISKKETKFGY